MNYAQKIFGNAVLGVFVLLVVYKLEIAQKHTIAKA